MEKSARPIRNRKQSRRAWPPGDTHRPIKRLFTPDIKKMLKDWLVRRRENPYPSRDEKKTLARESGLTYTQIANWFANWRRKLKNSGREPIKKSWGNLIKNYNTSAKGNVEQFSISSSDSIWGGGANNNNNEELQQRHHERIHYQSSNYSSSSYADDDDFNSFTNVQNQTNSDQLQYLKDKQPEMINPTWKSNKSNQIQKLHPQCFQISSTTTEDLQHLTIQKNFNSNISNNLHDNNNHLPTSNTKYKHQIMKKYLKDTNCTDYHSNLMNYNNNYPSSLSSNTSSGSPELSKWLESTANFTPNKNNYIEWNQRNKLEKKLDKSTEEESFSSNNFETASSIHHQKDELDAAEALANLASNYRQRMINFGINESIE